MVDISNDKIMSVIIDLNMVCVICLQDGELKSVFETDDTNKMKISDKIMKCSELVIDEDSKLPDKICDQCLLDLAATYRFLQNCETALSVFRTIQQEEDALATYELERQKIKIPSGLKIKKIKTENTAYIFPIELNQLPKTLEPLASEIRDIAVIQETGEQLPVDEERMDEVEYYEAEEILEDNTDDEIVEIKVEKHISSGNESEKAYEDFVKYEDCEIAIHKNEIFIKKEKSDIIKKETSVEESKNNVREDLSRRGRGRGRPKKVLNGPVERNTNSSHIPVLDESKKTKYQDPYDSVSSSDEVSNVLKQPALQQKIQNRSSLSPDAKPTKICDICGNSYKYQHALNAHMRRHNNDRPFNCEFCEKAFVSAVELRRHMRVHTGHKPYACQYCDRRFSDFGSRIKHERTHTGERPYKCTTCSKSFAYAHVLSVHLRTHTGEKKFKCLLCGKGFTKKAYLKTHTDQHERSTSFSGPEPITNEDYEKKFKCLLCDKEFSKRVQLKAHTEEHVCTTSLSSTTNLRATERNDRGGFVAMKDVALEECIFTTEYIDEDDADSATTSAIQMNEEHLELDENDQGDDYGTVAYIKHIKSDDQSSCEIDS